MNPKDLLHHSEFLRRIAFSLIRDTHLAEDLFQQAFMENWEDPKQDLKNPRSWFATEMKNRARMHVRSESRRRKREKATSETEAQPATDDLVANLEVRTIVTSTVQELEEIYRQPVMMRFYEGLSNSDAADRLGIPLETMRTRLKRGLKKVRTKLELRYNGDTKRWVIALAPIAGLPFTAEELDAAIESAMGSASDSNDAIGRDTDRKKRRSSAFSIRAVSILIVLIIGVSILLYTFVGNSTVPESAKMDDQVSVDEVADLIPEISISNTPPTVEKETIPPVSQVPKGIRVEGRFLTRNEEIPIAGVELKPSLVYSDTDLMPLEIVESDEEGFFAFNLPEGSEVGLQSMISFIQTEGYRSSKHRSHFRCRDNIFKVGNIYLDQDRIWEIQITDSEDNPITNAHAAMYRWANDEPIFECFSGTDGIIRFSEEALQHWIRGPGKINMRICANGCADYVDQFGGVGQFLEFPAKIVLKQPACLVSKVVDDATGEPIEGADCWLTIRGGKAFIKGLMKDNFGYSATTDWQGTFSLSDLSHSNCRLCLHVIYDGYYEIIVDIDEITEEIRLVKPNDTVRCIAVEAESRVPLINYTLIMKKGLYCRTDDRGCVEIPRKQFSRPRHHRFIEAWAPDAEQPERIFVEKVILEEGDSSEVELGFEKVINYTYRIRVEDMMGEPLGGVHAMLVFPPAVSGNTDKNGEVELKFALTKKTQAKVQLRHPECMGVVEQVSLPTDSVMKFTMARGYCFQNLKMVDEEGNPLPHDFVRVMLLSEGNEPLSHVLPTDQFGLLDLYLPKATFQSCTVSYVKDPNVEAAFDLDELFSGKEIRLQKRVESGPEWEIGGVVSDEEGNPMKGITCRLGNFHEGHMILISKNTAEDGSFRFPAKDGKTYELDISPMIIEGKCVWSPNRKPLIRGQKLDIVMRAYTSVQVYFGELPSPPGLDELDNNLWLETPDGQVLEMEGTYIDNKCTALMGMPEEKMRVVLDTNDGIRYCSPYFDVKGMIPVETNLKPFAIDSE